jgi:hypothetical protein
VSASTDAVVSVHGGFWRRLFALTRKETRQLLRDRSNVAIGLVLPVLLIVLFGYGISLDVKDARVALVVDDHSPAVVDLLSGLPGSSYITPVPEPSMQAAERALAERRAEAILRVPGDFSREFAAGRGMCNSSCMVPTHPPRAPCSPTSRARWHAVRCASAVRRTYRQGPSRSARTLWAASRSNLACGSTPPTPAPGIWCRG